MMQKSPLLIRPLEDRDLLATHRIFLNAIQILGGQWYDRDQTAAWASAADAVDSLKILLQRGVTLVVESGGQVIAFGQLDPVDVINMLYCDPHHARTGVGGLILAELESRAIRMGQIVIDTKASLAAYEFFTKNGYHSLAEEMVIREGIAIPRFSMRKMLVHADCPRWAIIGNAGSGKTTLAAKISEIKGARVLDLDTIAWEKNRTIPTRSPLAESRDFIRDFCYSHDAWVLEGCYENLVAETFSFDPCLVWIRIDPNACMERCRTRGWERHKFPSESEHLAALPALLDWVAAYYQREGAMSESSHRALFENYPGRKCEFRADPSFTE